MLHILAGNAAEDVQSVLKAAKSGGSSIVVRSEESPCTRPRFVSSAGSRISRSRGNRIGAGTRRAETIRRGCKQNHDAEFRSSAGIHLQESSRLGMAHTS